MKYKKIFLTILSVILVTIFILFTKTICNSFYKEKVYIVFNDVENDFEQYNWLQHKDIFPPSFNPQIANSSIEELAKLNISQKKDYDSIRKNDFSYPKKIRKSKMGNNEYFISISELISVKFNILSEKRIEIDDIRKLNVISTDSLIQLIPELSYKIKTNNNKIQYYILDIPANGSNVKCIEVFPIVLEYN